MGIVLVIGIISETKDSEELLMRSKDFTNVRSKTVRNLMGQKEV